MQINSYANFTSGYKKDNNDNPRRAWGLFVLAAFVALVVAFPVARERLHTELHTEADEIRQCYNAGNILQRWVYLDPVSGLQRDHCLVELPDGRIGDRIIQFCKKSGWLEVTAFIVGDGTLTETILYLTRRACSQVYPP